MVDSSSTVVEEHNSVQSSVCNDSAVNNPQQPTKRKRIYKAMSSDEEEGCVIPRVV